MTNWKDIFNNIRNKFLIRGRNRRRKEELKRTEIEVESEVNLGNRRNKMMVENLEVEVVSSDNKSILMTKFLKNLSLLNSSSSSSFFNNFAVLILDGSMNPIHKQHVSNFEIAKREIESRSEENVKVVAGYISPSNDGYVKRKLGNEAISADHRIEMIRLATEDSDWIEVDKQGVSFPTGDPLDKVNYLSDYLNSSQEVLKYCNGVKLIYLCGSDLVERDWKNDWKTFAELIENGYKTVIIGRENSADWKSKCENYLNLTCGYKKWNEFILLVDGPIKNEMSSTKIRNVIAGKEDGDLLSLLSPKVLEYIQKHELLKKRVSEFQEGFSQFQAKVEIAPKLNNV